MKKNSRPVRIAVVVALATEIATPTPARADLFGGDVAVLGSILAETIHPVVRPGTAEARKMAEEYNRLLGAR